MNPKSDVKSNESEETTIQESHKVESHNDTKVIAEVRCPHVIKNKHTGRMFRCNYKAMEVEFAKGTTKCRNCSQLFSFEVNTTHIRFADDYHSSLANPIQDVLE